MKENCECMHHLKDDDFFEPFKNRYPGMDEVMVKKFFNVLRGCILILMSMEKYFYHKGLSKARFHLMMELFRHPEDGMNPKTLSCRCNVSSATMTGLIDTLEKDGLVERIRDLKDRRRISVRLTSKAFQFLDVFLPSHQENIRAFIYDFTDEEIRQFGMYLSKLHQGIEKEVGKISEESHSK